MSEVPAENVTTATWEADGVVQHVAPCTPDCTTCYPDHAEEAP